LVAYVWESIFKFLVVNYSTGVHQSDAVGNEFWVLEHAGYQVEQTGDDSSVRE
jgi:hypothetical protein